MAWTIRGLKPYLAWFAGQDAVVQERIRALYLLLQEFGPELTRPHVGAIEGSQYRQMKELIVPHGGHEYRIFFAFDPNREGILLIAADKLPNGTYDETFYDRLVPRADALFSAHLNLLKTRIAETKIQQVENKHGKPKNPGSKRNPRGRSR